MQVERHNVAFMVGIVVGALLAAVAAALLTPASGKQTREQLAALIDGLRSGGEGAPGQPS